VKTLGGRGKTPGEQEERNLVNDYTDYEHSSASFYELGIVKNYRPFDFRFI
jgi:hypothetical protein